MVYPNVDAEMDDYTNKCRDKQMEINWTPISQLTKADE